MAEKTLNISHRPLTIKSQPNPPNITQHNKYYTKRRNISRNTLTQQNLHTSRANIYNKKDKSNNKFNK